MFKKNIKRKVLSLLVIVMLFSSTASFGSGFSNTYRFIIPIFNNIQWRQIPISRYYEPNEDSVPEEEVIEEPAEEIEIPAEPVEEVKKPEVPVKEEQPVQPVRPERPVERPIENQAPRGVSQEEQEVLRLVNIERQKAGLNPFTLSAELSHVARDKSKDMAHNNYFSHQSPTRGSPFDMMRAYEINYRTAGENIAKGYNLAALVVNGWMNSPGHRANILNSSFNTLGVGYYNYNGTAYWTQMFTN